MVIESGYMNADASCAPLWVAIYEQCQSIIVNSMELIYSDTSEIIETLASVFKKEKTTEKQLENCAFSF